MKITIQAKCPACSSRNVRHIGLDDGSGEDLYECQDCGQMACKEDFAG
jgi:uncharacterized Zn finger protein